MAKAKKKGCGTCGYAEWPTNKVGHVMKKNHVAFCLCPIPDLPDSVFTWNVKKLHKNKVHDDMGEDCPKWRPTCLARPEDSEPLIYERRAK